jgi:hypothetical protein
MVNCADVGEYDVTRYQARVMGGGNWIQLASERTQGWNEFKIVIHGDTVDIYVNGELDPWGTAIPRAAGAAIDRVVQVVHPPRRPVEMDGQTHEAVDARPI